MQLGLAFRRAEPRSPVCVLVGRAVGQPQHGEQAGGYKQRRSDQRQLAARRHDRRNRGHQRQPAPVRALTDGRAPETESTARSTPATSQPCGRSAAPASGTSSSADSAACLNPLGRGGGALSGRGLASGRLLTAAAVVDARGHGRASAGSEALAHHAPLGANRQTAGQWQRQDRPQAGVDAHGDQLVVAAAVDQHWLGATAKAGRSPAARARARPSSRPRPSSDGQARALLDRAQQDVVRVGIQHDLDDARATA